MKGRCAMADRNEKPIGLTASVGYQIGVRRTIPITQAEAWERLTSKDGIKLWIGDTPPIIFSKGEKFESSSGLSGEFSVVKPKEQLRLTWQPKGWSKASTLQIRIIPGKSDSNKTVLSFHQENLSDARVREEMKHRWEQVIAQIAAAV